MIDSVKHLLVNKSGTLTRKLLQEPGAFGLGNVVTDQKPERTTTLTCGFCSTGCGLNIHLKGGKAVGLSPDTHYPVNLGMACPKGWESLAVMDSDERGTSPLLRDKEGRMQETDWATAANTFAERFKAIQDKHGKESVAFISTGQLVSEEMALLGAFGKFGMGMLHGDGNTRQCMATAVVAYKQSFGFDAPPYSYKDFEESDVLVFIGANPCIAHPIMWERVMLNPHNPEIIVVDPRRTETAMTASQHLPLAPKSDLTLFYGLANLLINLGAVDEAFVNKHTNHFSGFAEHIKPYTLERVAAETGLQPEQIQASAEAIANGTRVSFWWTMGVNQHHEGVRVAQAIINIALMTGNIGRPGTGANSITGQCNAMGSRLFSNTTNLLGGHNFSEPAHRQKIADILDIDVHSIPGKDSLPYHKILEGVENGSIKGLWVLCTNPAHSWIERPRLQAMLKHLDFLVVQDIYKTTETAAAADLFLPAAGWGEKEGTFINSERRIGLVKRVKPAPGDALSDFWILKLLAEAWGCGDMFRKWESPEATFGLLQEISKGQPCDISGIDGYAMLNEHGGVQWPFPAGSTLEQNERRLFEDGQFFTEDGKANFIFDNSAVHPEPPDAEYPFILLTGRGSASQWHTQTRTDKSAILRQLYPKDPYVEVHPQDAKEKSIQPNQWIEVESRRGKIKARASITPCIQPGQLFVPMHTLAANQLTNSVFDPHSHQPSYKYCAAKLVV